MTAVQMNCQKPIFKQKPEVMILPPACVLRDENLQNHDQPFRDQQIKKDGILDGCQQPVN